MNDQSKTKYVLIQELASLRQRIAGMEQAESPRKQVEEDLLESEELFRLLSEAAFEAIVIHEKGVILNANDQYFKMFGYEPGEALGKEMISVTIVPESLELVKKQMATDSLGPYESIGLRKDGTRFPIEIRNRKMKYKGRIVRFGAIRDITERKRAEDARRQSEENFRRSLDDSPLGVRISTAEGDTIFANRAMLEFCGYDSIEELKAAPLLKLYAPESFAEVQIRKGKRKRGDYSPSEYEISVARKDGEVRRLHVFRKEVLWDGERQFQVVYEDITELKQAEEALHASLREKELLLSEVHHRVKNNMQVISGLLDLQARSSGNPELTGMLNEGQSRIQAMALVHHKLYNSKDFVKIDLADYVTTLSRDLFKSYRINPRKIELVIPTDGDVCVDINKAIPCGLILNELISNVLKHAFPGDGQGELQIIIRKTKSTEIEIVVRDNGLGLPDDVDIHQPKTVGLYLVNGLVKNQLDGQIEVRRDNGTEFRIIFSL